MNGFEPRFIELAGQINESMPHFVVDKVTDALNNDGKSVRGRAHPRARRRVQARRQRRARVAGAARHQDARRQGRGPLQRPVRADDPRGGAPLSTRCRSPTATSATSTASSS